jgi:hypothetical protein
VTAAGESTLSAVRSLLIAVGGVLVAQGWLTAELVQQIVGAVLIIGPAVWGMVQKVQADRAAAAQAALALNVGVALADVTVGKTPSVPAAKAPELIKAFEPLVIMPLSPEVAPQVLAIPPEVAGAFVKPPERVVRVTAYSSGYQPKAGGRVENPAPPPKNP